MKRLLVACAVAIPLAALTAGPAFAEVKTREKTTVKIEALPGWLMRMMGAKKDGILSSTAVKGDRKVTTTSDKGQIIDLAQEKIYDLDFGKKEYRVTTFEELRRRMKEAQDRARQEQQREEKGEQAAKPEKEYEIDFDLKDTGQKRQLAGHEARQVIMTVTVREKGRSLEEAGGLVATTDSWLGPQIPAMKEVADFDLRYWQKVYGGDATIPAEQMAALMAMFPLLGKAQERMRKENVNLDGTPLLTTISFEAVKSAEQVAQESQQKTSGGGGGIGGMVARRMMKKKEDPKPRVTIMTTEVEVQEITTTVPPADLELPAGFKEKK